MLPKQTNESLKKNWRPLDIRLIQEYGQGPPEKMRTKDRIKHENSPKNQRRGFGPPPVPGVRHTVTDASERPVHRESQRCVEEFAMGVSDIYT